MKLSSILAPLIAAKVPHEVILEAVIAFEGENDAALEKRRASDRERQSRRRHVMSRDVTVTPCDTPTPDKEKSPTPPKEINPIPISSLRSATMTDVRDLLWSEGVSSIKRQTGKTEASVRSLIGRWCRDTRDDCRLILSAINQAEVDRVGDPIAWVTRSIKRQQGPPSLTPFQQRHQSAIDAFDQALGQNRNDEFASDIIDIKPANCRAE